PALPDVLLPGRRVTHLCRVRIQPRRAARAALVQEVPALIERHFELLQLRALLFGHALTGLLAEELMFLVGELVDLRKHFFVVHGCSPPLRHERVRRPLYSYPARAAS